MPDGSTVLTCHAPLGKCIDAIDKLCKGSSYEILYARDDQKIYGSDNESLIENRSSIAAVHCLGIHDKMRGPDAAATFRLPPGVDPVRDRALARAATSSAAPAPSASSAPPEPTAPNASAAPSAEVAPPRACVPGATQACVGAGACSGGQACLPDGSGFGPCDCGSATTADSANAPKAPSVPRSTKHAPK